MRTVLPLAATMTLALCACDCTYPGTADVPGDIHAFDPVAAAPAVQMFAGSGAQLVQMRVSHCPPTGTLDLEASYYGGRVPVRYQFVRPTQSRVDPSLPVGVRRETRPTEGVTVEVMEPRWASVMVNGNRTERHHLGMEASVSGAPSDATTALPACPLGLLWSAARSRGAPSDAVATITYDAHGYELVIPGTPVTLRFDPACREIPASP